MNRLFFALDLTPSDKALISQWRKQELSLQYQPIQENNLHITLAFLGNVTDEQQQLISLAAAEKHQQLNMPEGTVIKLKNLGYFAKPKVLYLTVAPDYDEQINSLASYLTNQAVAMGLYQPNHTFTPHLSIYRKASLETNVQTPQLTLTIPSFSLYHSQSTPHGVFYNKVITWAF